MLQHCSCTSFLYCSSLQFNCCQLKHYCGGLEALPQGQQEAKRLRVKLNWMSSTAGLLASSLVYLLIHLLVYVLSWELTWELNIFMARLEPTRWCTFMLEPGSYKVHLGPALAQRLDGMAELGS